MVNIEDWLASGKLAPADFTKTAIKTNSKQSVSDVVLHQKKMKEYLLGEWLDERNFPSYVKAKVRETFQSLAAYRQFYSPLSGSSAVDQNWMFSWPKVGIDLMRFLDSVLYGTTEKEDFLLRSAVRHGKSAGETLQWSPWCETIADLMQELKRTAVPERVQQNNDASQVQPKEDGQPAASGQAPPESDEELTADADSRSAIDDAAGRLVRQMACFAIEPATAQQIGELIKTSPLASVRSTPESGKVLVLFDCNVYGETDARPKLRVCPVGKPMVDKLLKGVLQGPCMQ